MINVSDTSKYNISNSVNGTVVASLFTIMNTQSSDVGRYTCHAENIIGIERSSGVLTVNGKYPYVCVHMCMCACMHVCVCMCVHVCVCVCVCVSRSLLNSQRI